eukprot:353069-Chlamydomonas_euryale.AAC.21
MAVAMGREAGELERDLLFFDGQQFIDVCWHGAAMAVRQAGWRALGLTVLCSCRTTTNESP